MDLPTCPSCGQSVLDDDAVDCPFCGSSLKGGGQPSKGAPRKSLPKVLPRTNPAAKPAAETTPKPAEPAKSNPVKSLPAVTAGKPAATTDDDPFAVDQSQHADAIAVQPRKTAGKTYEVVCPMCETHGFIASSAAGKQVRCCNPKCLVPVFEAPIPRKEAPPPPPPPPKPIGKWITMGLLGVAAIGAVVFWAIHRNDLSKEVRVDGIPGMGRKRPTADEDPKDSDRDAVVAVNEKSVAAWQKESLQRVIELAQSRNNARKPTCRRLSATDAVVLNDLKAAQTELDQLAIVGPQVPYEAIPPLTMIAWKHWKSGDKDQFEATLQAAMKAAGKLPERGRHAAQSAIDLAAALTLAGREAEGHELIARHQKDEPLDQLAALYEIVLQDGTFNLDRKFPGQATGRWEKPLSTAVTYLLFLHDEKDAALRWAKSDKDELAKTESILLWSTLSAAETLQTNPQADLTKILETVGTLPPSAQATYHARLADMLREQKNPAANQSLETAQRLLAGAAPQPIRLNTVKELMSWSAPSNKATLIATARAAAELAFVQSRFGPTQKTLAGNSFKLALSTIRSLAPSVDAIQAVDQSLTKAGDDAAIAELRRLYNLDTADEARRRLTQFKTIRGGLQTSAEARFRLQCSIVIAAIDNGMLDEVLQELQSRISASEANERDPYLDTAIPQYLALKFAAAGKADRQAETQKLIGNKQPKAEYLQPLVRDHAAKLIADGKFVEAAAELNPHLRDNGTLHLDALRLACRLLKTGSFDPQVREYFAALGTIQEQELREDGFRLTAALATLGGQEKSVFKVAESESDRHAVATSIFSGLIEGIARRKPAALPAPNEAAGDKKAPAKKGPDDKKAR